MDIPLATMDPTFATFALAVLVLIAGVAVTWKALSTSTDAERAKHAFAAVGVLFGLLAAGGLGSLFAKQAADDAAEKSATQAADTAAEQVADQVSTEVQDAIDQPPAGTGAGAGSQSGQ